MLQQCDGWLLRDGQLITVDGAKGTVEARP
jgi:phosphohistidine swiveling domain-containing protein